MRLKKKLENRSMVMVLVVLLAGSGLPVEAARYLDLTGFWGEKYINNLSDRGIIAPAEDGKFNPAKPITRAELAVWLVKVLKLENQPVAETSSFSDVKTTDPYYRAVEIIRQNNYVSGYKDGFRPKQFIQRGEMISILARAINQPNPDEKSITEVMNKFNDRAKVPQWAKAGITKAAKAGILVVKDPKVIDATGISTRGETAVILANLYDYLNRENIAQATENAERGQPPPPTQGQQPPAGQAQQPQQPPQSGWQTGAPGAPSGYAQVTPQYQGQVQRQDMYVQPQAPQGPPGGYPGYPPQVAAAPPGAYIQPGNPYPYPNQAMPPQPGAYPYSQMLTARVATIAAGTMISASLKNTINSGSSQPGETIEATISQPVYSGGSEVIPAGSRLIGQITNVVSAKRFKFGANGKVDVKFTQLVTPGGQQVPLSGSVDTTQVKLTGGTTAGRVGKGALTTAVGAGSGAALGTALGAIVGATSNGRVGKATGMGAVFGTAIGGGAGLVGAGVRKGSEVKITAGSELPIRVDQTFQVTTGGAPQYPPPAYGQPQYPPPYPGGPPPAQPYYQ